MSEVTSPIIATALVLCAVFVPTAFISGLTGQFYKQFAITIAISTVISAFNSLTLPGPVRHLLPNRDAPKDWFPAASISRWVGSSGRSTAFSPGPATRFRRRRLRPAHVGGRPGGLCRPGLSDRVEFNKVPPASFRPRTSNTWSPSPSCPMARRWTAPKR